jgi:hypothetical protein
VNASLTCIVDDGTIPSDGTLPRVPFRQDLTWPEGYGGTISCVVQHASGSAYDLTGCSLVLVVREHAEDPVPVLKATATIESIPVVGGGGAAGSFDSVVFAIPVLRELVAGVTYFFDVRLATPGPVAWQVVPASKLTPTLAITKSWETT